MITSNINNTTGRNNTSATLPQPFSNEFRIILLVFYCIVFVFGLLGNTMTCVAVISFRNMRRSIHFYIFNLAVADLLLLFLYVPTQMIFVHDYMSWRMGKNMCIVAFAIICLCLSASIGTLIAISVDRYRGLRRPFDWRAASSRHAKIVIPFIWFLSAATAFPLAYHGDIALYGDKIICYEAWPDIHSMVVYWSLIMVVQYILPLFLITALHVHMTVIVSRQNQEEINELHKRMIRMVVMLMLIYSICNGMQHINFYLSVYLNIHREPFGNYLFVLSNFAISLQAAINPLIYGISRNDYKSVFKNYFSTYTMKILKVLCKIEPASSSDGKEVSSNVTYNCEITDTPLLAKKNIENVFLLPELSKTLIQEQNTAIFPTAKILKVENGVEGADKGQNSNFLTVADKSQYLSVPKRAVRKTSVRFDTLRYMSDEEFRSHMEKTTRKKSKENDLANHIVSQLITSNNNHPMIVVTDYENDTLNGDPSGKYGTIVEKDYPLLVENKYLENHNKPVTEIFPENTDVSDWPLLCNDRFSKWVTFLDDSPESVL